MNLASQNTSNKVLSLQIVLLAGALQRLKKLLEYMPTRRACT